MSSGSSSAVLRQFRTLFGAGTVAAMTDGQLLERFLGARGEDAEVAFAGLVARHGPMVLGVCRRALADPDDADDAFQATFLILVRKARSVRVDDSLGRWLYGVSRRVASRARAGVARRRRIERSGVDLPERSSTGTDRHELKAILDEELARLAEPYRSAIVLCDLGGLTHEEAARDLRCPVGTVKSRLSRGREKLRGRLARRGLTPSALASGTALPVALANSTIRAASGYAASGVLKAGTVPASAVVLTQGVLKAMTWTKLKLAAAAALSLSLTLGVAATGAGGPARPDEKPSAAGAKKSPVEAKLDQPVTLNINAQPLGEAVDLIHNYSGLNIILDSKGLAENGLSSKTPVTLTCNGIKLKLALKYLLRPLQLTYKVAEDVVIITPTKVDRASLEKGMADLEGELERARRRASEDQQAPGDTARVRRRVRELEAAAARIESVLGAVLERDDPGPKPAGPANRGRKTWPNRLPSDDPPRELSKVSMPDYVVEPPDILVVEVLEALEGRPITGERLIRPDGKISLGFYGDVYVSGLTLDEVKAKIALHLREFLSDEILGLSRVDIGTGKVVPIAPARTSRIFVDVAAYNSKVYYVQGEVGTPGRLPHTGNETVLDAINYSGGLTSKAAKDRIRLVRPAPGMGVAEQTLLIDLPAIIEKGDTSTNYQLLPGDRLIVDRDPKADPDEAAPAKSGEKAPADVDARLQTVERKLDEVLKALERLPKP